MARKQPDPKPTRSKKAGKKTQKRIAKNFLVIKSI
jgi:hypothetical protein